jgi:uncharacterized surface protein with fasciclin (FAS1) repeats
MRFKTMFRKHILSLGLVTLLMTSVVPAAQAAIEGNIIETVQRAGSFKVFIKALGSTELIHTLQSGGPYTVFAPTDAAFAKLPKGQLDNLLKPENKGLLTKILANHIVPQEVSSKFFNRKQGDISTIGGSKVNMRVVGGKVKVNDANIIKTDLQAKNGIVHVIDKVLLPGAYPPKAK